MHRKSSFLLFFLAALLLCSAAQATQLAVVVDKSNGTSSLSSADLAKILKLSNAKWPDGKQVVLVLRGVPGTEMQLALQKLSNMSGDQVKDLMNAHRSAIVVVNSEQDVLKSVSTIPGAIGLVDVYSLTSGVNVLKVDGKLPLEPGYLLRGGQ
jgi:ABC-type phosphate transport system substrate-binding protein